MAGIADLRASLFGLVGMFFGGLLTWIVIAPGAVRSAGADGSAASGELLAAQLRSEALLEDIARTLPALAGGAPATPRRTDDGELSSAALLERLASLDETLTRLISALGTGSGARGVVGTPLAWNPSRGPATDVLARLTARPNIDVDLQHLGWTMQQVLDAYGRPSDNYASNDVVEQRWFYDLPEGAFGFYFIDGRVVKVNY